ncbi:MAG: glycoside hydrolase family 2 protein [Bacteroidia bacterium]|nr:glycoside hydrolase family 2 protein [Bacteroidia bacterium]
MLFGFHLAAYTQHSSRLLNTNWTFRQETAEVWDTAQVPGNVYNDLFINSLIPDPYFSNTLQQLTWIENTTWEYKTNFQISEAEFKNEKIELELDGLDTYAAVFVNSELIFEADNMFRKWTTEVKRVLKIGTNELLIRFYPTNHREKKSAAGLSYTLPEGERVFTRKSQVQYGWDFAPRLLTFGIWKPIRLHFYSKARLHSVNYTLLSVNKEKAKLAIELESTRLMDNKLSVLTEIKGLLKRSTHHLQMKSKGKTIDTFYVTIDQPKLWWCQGIGQPYLYDLKLTLLSDEMKLDSLQMKVGLRKIELVREPDSVGHSFYFKLNNRPVFIKGANVVPSGPMLSSAMNDEQLVEKAKSLGINMLRVWGGGVYGSDDFYKACDRNGIFVWQDMPFACAMYPGDSVFLNSVKAELNDQLKRLRTHASLALLCGNNESDEGWHNWGWQKLYGYSYQDSLKIYRDYLSLFHDLIPRVCTKLAPNIPYLPSSPVIGWGHPESLTHFDSHYWGVWWGMEHFENYTTKVGRFMSEYGFQSYPEMASLTKFLPLNELSLNSNSLKFHQKNNKGDETIRTYLAHSYPVPDNLFHFSYASQLLQRDGMELAIRSHRSQKPRCMGTLFWQFNDAWPGITWSALDYYGTPKAFYYKLKSLYAPFLIVAQKNKSSVILKFISDTTLNAAPVLSMQLMDFYGKVLWQRSKLTTLKPFAVSSDSIRIRELGKFDSSGVYLSIRLINKLKVIAETHIFFCQPKALHLPETDIQLTKLSETEFEIRSKVFVKDLYLYADRLVELTDNYFDLEPFVTKKIWCKKGEKLPEMDEIKNVSLKDLLND